ncbi:hypothetical protein [Alkalihalophilus marmarensis]|uniref:hypothetical protein n=1 Tax=Alkalihalophilus marmarensis TaxID=521377 RepID=UPI002E23BCC1|nr:hypothetical protein [Alkalihalophilus marmarensis]
MVEITSMKIDGHSIPVQPGLSELLNSANALTKPDAELMDSGVHREVVRENGKLFTVLTLNNKKKLKKEA